MSGPAAPPTQMNPFIAGVSCQQSNSSPAVPSTRSAPSSPDVSPQSSPRPPRANNDRLTLLTRLVRKGEKKGLFVEKMPASIYQVKCQRSFQKRSDLRGVAGCDSVQLPSARADTTQLTSADPVVERRLRVSEDQRSNLTKLKMLQPLLNLTPATLQIRMDTHLLRMYLFSLFYCPRHSLTFFFSFSLCCF